MVRFWNNISRGDDGVALPSTSLLGDCVCIALDLEQQTLELLNTPPTVRVNVEVESTSSCNVVLNTRTVNFVDGTDDFAVDFAEDLTGKDVNQFRNFRSDHESP